MSLLDHAEKYAARGWSVIPIGSEKRPALSGWKRYSVERPTPADLAAWFGRNGVQGLAVICGAVSGGLFIRDFDREGAYDEWKGRFAALAGALPTVMTARGFHVYGRAAGAVRTRKFDDGELRGEGSYTLAPPSIHPSGTVYEWMIGLPDGDLPILDPAEAGLISGGAYPTQDDKFSQSDTRRQDPDPTQEATGDTGMACVGLHGMASIIKNTLPTGIGLRNDGVFRFARALKSADEFKSLPVSALRAGVEEWHRQALPTIGTKDFGETWADFCHAWTRIKHPIGETMSKIVELSEVSAPPDEAALYTHPAIQKLVALCAELQRRAGEADFFLDCRTAGKSVGTHHDTANRWLNMLVVDRLLERVEQGTRGRATRWRWKGKL